MASDYWFYIPFFDGSGDDCHQSFLQPPLDLRFDGTLTTMCICQYSITIYTTMCEPVSLSSTLASCFYCSPWSLKQPGNFRAVALSQTRVWQNVGNGKFQKKQVSQSR